MKPRIMTYLSILFLVLANLSMAESCQPEWLGSPLNQGLFGTVDVLAVHDDGSGKTLYAAPASINTDSGLKRGVVRWSGKEWELVGMEITGSIADMIVFDAGSGPELYIVGNFTDIDGDSFNHIARWDGQDWQPVGGGFSQRAEALAIHDDGSGQRLYVSGWFTVAGDQLANRIARWDGVSWSNLGDGLNGIGYSIESFRPANAPGALLVVGGMFTVAGENHVPGIASWNGTEWVSLGLDLAYGADTTTFPRSMTVDRTDPFNELLYMGGNITSIDTNIVNYIISWDGSEWARLGGGLSDRPTTVRFLLGQDSATGRLFVGGNFRNADVNVVNNIAQWDGASWLPMQEGITGPAVRIEDMILFDDNSGTGPAVFVAGRFSSASGLPSSSIAKWGCEDGNGVIFFDRFSQPRPLIHNANLVSVNRTLRDP